LFLAFTVFVAPILPGMCVEAVYIKTLFYQKPENGSLFYQKQKMHGRNLDNAMPIKSGISLFK
jgi:hypothetical protein